MQYMLLIYTDGEVGANWDRLSQDEQKATLGEYGAIFQTPGVVGGAQLAPVTSATTVRVQDGRTLTTDGPFAETKEVLGGFYTVEADDIDKALEIAARIPAARMGGKIEVRPLVEM
jgi:hypothetical protein